MTPKKPNGTVCRVNAYFILLAFFLSTIAARADLQFDVFVGYDQVVPEHGWFPITCELHNDGPSFNAVIEVTPGEFGGGQVRRVAVDLPTNTRKRVVIPVFSSGQRWSARLVDSHGNVRSEQTGQNLKIMGNHFPVVAALARTVGGMPVFPETADNQWSSRFVAARLQTALFPDNPLALEGIDMLYISSEKAVELTVGQATALTAWLENGGHLVLGVEQVSDLNGVPWLRDMLPCVLDKTINLKAHDALQQWSRARVSSAGAFEQQARRNRLPTAKGWNPGPPPNSPRAAPVNDPGDVASVEFPADETFDAAPMQIATGAPRDGLVLIGDESTPLAFEGKRGRGRLTVLGFSPEREPFISWKGRGWFWSRLAEVPASAYQTQQGQQTGQLSSDSIFGAMIDSRQIRKLPLGWLLALLAAYLVVIGPLDQYWLKKINRQMLTWITFPGYVLIFSGLIYWIGFHLRAGELEWNELNMVDVLPHNDRAVLRGETYVSIYSPANADYEIASDQPFATLRSEFQGYYGGGLEGSRVSVLQRGNNFDADAVVPVWTSQLYVSDWLQSSSIPFTMTAEHAGNTWKVIVENKMDRKLDNALVILDGRVFELGVIPASESKTFKLEISAGRLLRNWVQEHGQMFVRAAQARRTSFGNNEAGITDLAGSAMAVSFLSEVNTSANQWETFSGPADLDLTRFAVPGWGILLAWDPDHSPTAPLNRFSVKRTHRNTLLRLVVPLDS